MFHVSIMILIEKALKRYEAFINIVQVQREDSTSLLKDNGDDVQKARSILLVPRNESHKKGMDNSWSNCPVGDMNRKLPPETSDRRWRKSKLQESIVYLRVPGMTPSLTH